MESTTYHPYWDQSLIYIVLDLSHHHCVVIIAIAITAAAHINDTHQCHTSGLHEGMHGVCMSVYVCVCIVIHMCIIVNECHIVTTGD